MNDSTTLCVFCSSSSEVPEQYKTLASEVGQLCANLKLDLVYGGARSGLMGIVADSALSGGSKVTGVLPECLKNHEHAHEGLTELITTRDLHERQKMMAEKSDLFLVLPGGMGTLAEFFEIMTWKQIKLHNKKTILFNQNGYWTPMINMIHQMQTQKFLHDTPENLFEIATDLNTLKKILLQNI